MKKRVGIFLFYNPEGIVYEYVDYLLDRMSECLDDLAIVCNGFLSDEGRARLQRHSRHVVVRPNEGFDFMAWKLGILEVIGLDKIRQYDELILFNDSFFGPLYPFENVFDQMDRRTDLDFWGLSSHGAVAADKNGGRPRYLQTYFLVFRKALVASADFEAYWTGLEPCETFKEHVENVACRFTEHFENLGYRWAAFASTDDLEDPEGEKNLSHHMYNSFEMIANRKLPIIKRKTFTMNLVDFLRYGNGSALPDTLEYIERCTPYDSGLIWDYLLENCYLIDLMRSLRLMLVLPTRHTRGKRREDVSAAVIAHLYYDDLFEQSMTMLRNVPSYMDVYVTTNTEAKAEQVRGLGELMGFENLHVRVVGNRGRDVAALLVGCKDVPHRYEYLCFVHDKKPSYTQHVQSGRAFANILMTSMLASTSYIENIITEFEDNPRLGLVVAPKPHHSSYFSRWPESFWAICYDQTNAVLARLNVEAPITRTKDCIAIGTAFWCRTKALKPLFDEEWSVEDFCDEPFPADGSISHGIERSFPYIAQSQRFYTKEVLPDVMAKPEVEDFRYLLDETLVAVDGNRNFKVDTTDFQTYLRTLRQFVSKNMMTRRERYVKKAYAQIKKRFPVVKRMKAKLRRG